MEKSIHSWQRGLVQAYLVDFNDSWYGFNDK